MMTLGWPWPIYGKVKFGNLGFYIGKIENSGFFQKLLKPVTWNLEDSDSQVIELMKVWKVNVIFDLCPRAFTYEN